MCFAGGQYSWDWLRFVIGSVKYCKHGKVLFCISFKLFYQSIAHVWADTCLTRPTNQCSGLLDPGFTVKGFGVSVAQVWFWSVWLEFRHFWGFFTRFWGELNVEACNNSWRWIVRINQTGTHVSQTDQWNPTDATSMHLIMFTSSLNHCAPSLFPAYKLHKLMHHPVSFHRFVSKALINRSQRCTYYVYRKSAVNFE